MKRLLFLKKIWLLMLILSVVIVTSACKERKPVDDGLDSYHQYLNLLNDDYSADIIIKGDTTYLDNELNYRCIDVISEETVTCNRDYGYQAIIIIDIEGEVNLTEEEIQFIGNYVFEKNKDVIYLGRQHLDKFTDMISIPSLSEIYEGIGIYGSFPEDYSKLGIGTCIGVWRSTDTKVYQEDEMRLTWCLISQLSYVATGEAYVN